MKKHVAAALLWVCLGVSPMATAQVYINEIMAVNQSYGTDPQGDAEDWVELVNAGNVSVNLGGYYLSDDPDNPQKWQFPTNQSGLTRLPARGHLVVWADSDTQASGLHAGFNLSSLGETLVLSSPSGDMVDRITYEPLRADVTYGRDALNAAQWGVLAFPTPGMANMPVTLGFASTPVAEQASGFHDQPFSLSLSTPLPGAAIWITLDGSHPRTSSTALLYSQPVFLDRTTCVRAIVLKTGYLPSDVVTRTYLFMSDTINQPRNPEGFPSKWKSVTADYEMDPDIVASAQYAGKMQEALLSLPSLSVVMDVDHLFGSQGIYANPGSRGDTWERPSAVELIWPDGREGFHVDCGIRIQGGYFRSANASEKHSFRLLFKSMYGASTLRYPLFGWGAVDEFNTLTLRAGANDGYAWNSARNTEQYTRDEFARRLQRDTGQAASHGTFVHLYINGLYWGLYNPVERPDDAFSASYYGGEREDWDVFSHKGFSVHEGDKSALNQMLSLCQSAASSFEDYQRLQGLDPDGQRNTEFPHLLDVPNYIDYMIVNYWGGNWDWPWNNYWLARNRTPDSTGFKFYCWDTEDIMLSPRSPLNLNKVANPDARDVGQLHGALRQNPEYRLQFADRIHRLFFNNGIMTEAALVDHYADLAREIENAMIPESARWGDMHHSSPQTQADWVAMRDRLLTSYLPQRSAIVLQQFKNAGLYPTVGAPEFIVNGSFQTNVTCPVNSLLVMGAPAGVVWYTLDGTDPRIPGSDQGSDASTITLVSDKANKTVLVPTGPVNETWQGGAAFDDTAWLGGTGGVGYENNNGYQNYFDIDLRGQMVQGNTACYIRTPFDLSEDVTALQALRLNVRYDDGFVAYLNGVEVARANAPGTLSWNARASTQHSDGEAVTWVPFDISTHLGLLNSGSNILAIHGLNISPTSSDFLINATLAATVASEGSPAPVGVSDIAMEWTSPITLSHTVQVKARTLHNGQWSAMQESVYSVGAVEDLRVTEIMYHPKDPNTEYIELTNTGTSPVSLNFIAFTDGIDFTFDTKTLEAGQSTIVVQDLAAFQAKHGSDVSVAGQYTGSLSNSGETVELQDALGQVIERVKYQDDWYAQTDGDGYSLTRLDSVADPNTPEAWTAAGPNPGSE